MQLIRREEDELQRQQLQRQPAKKKLLWFLAAKTKAECLQDAAPDLSDGGSRD
jgi:hypothetical protein